MAEVRNLSNTRDTLEFVDLDEALPLAEGLDSELDESVTELLVTLRRSLVGFTDGWRASLFRGATGFVDDWRTSLFADIAGLSDTVNSVVAASAATLVDDWRTSFFADIAGFSDTVNSVVAASAATLVDDWRTSFFEDIAGLSDTVNSVVAASAATLVDDWRTSFFADIAGLSDTVNSVVAASAATTVDDWRTSLFADIAGLSDTLGSALLPDYFEDAATWKLSGSLSEPSVPIEPMKTLNMAPSVDEGTASSVIPPCPSSHDLFDEAERAALRTLIENDARLTQGPRQDTPAQSSGWPMAPVWFWGPPAAAPRLRVSLDWVGVAGVLVGVLAFMFAFTSESERLALRDIALEVLWLCFILLSQ